jgi:hypothetical protein
MASSSKHNGRDGHAERWLRGWVSNVRLGKFLQA